MTASSGEEVKNRAAQLSEPGEGPKAKSAAPQAGKQPGLLSLSLFLQAFASFSLLFIMTLARFFH